MPSWDDSTRSLCTTSPECSLTSSRRNCAFRSRRSQHPLAKILPPPAGSFPTSSAPTYLTFLHAAQSQHIQPSPIARPVTPPAHKKTGATRESRPCHLSFYSIPIPYGLRLTT